MIRCTVLQPFVTSNYELLLRGDTIYIRNEEMIFYQRKFMGRATLRPDIDYKIEETYK